MSNYITNAKRKNSNTTLNPQLYRLIKSIALHKECYINSLLEEGMLYIVDKYKNFIPSNLYEEELNEYKKLKQKSRD